MVIYLKFGFEIVYFIRARYNLIIHDNIGISYLTDSYVIYN